MSVPNRHPFARATSGGVTSLAALALGLTLGACGSDAGVAGPDGVGQLTEVEVTDLMLALGPIPALSSAHRPLRSSPVWPGGM